LRGRIVTPSGLIRFRSEIQLASREGQSMRRMQCAEINGRQSLLSERSTTEMV
jgi:hypothetical protein